MSSEKKVSVADKATGIEEGIKTLQAYAGSYSYSIITKEADGFLVTHKLGMPCYGELRPYKKLVNPKQADTRGKDPKPSDLPYDFPEGEPVALVVAHLAHVTEHPLWKYVLDPERSPWRSMLKSCRVAPGVFVWDETDFLPTVLVSFLMTVRSFYENGSLSVYDDLKAIHPKASDGLLLFLVGSLHRDAVYDPETRAWELKPNKWGIQPLWDYNLHTQQISLSALLDGKPYDLDGGVTFRERGAYNRPYVHNLFGHGHSNFKTQSFWECSKSGKFPDIGKFVSELEALAAQPRPEEASVTGKNLLGQLRY